MLIETRVISLKNISNEVEGKGMDLLIRQSSKKAVPALVKDPQFHTLWLVDDDNHQTKIAHDLSITVEHWRGDSEAECRQTIPAIKNHFATMLLLSMSNPTAHRSQVVHVRCRLT